jgi:hypothetical protein
MALGFDVDTKHVDRHNVAFQNVDFQNFDSQNVDFQNFDLQLIPTVRKWTSKMVTIQHNVGLQ